MTGERGLTLIEVLVALAILGLGLLGMLAVVPVSTYPLQEGRQRSTATFLAEQTLDYVRSAPWTFTPDNDCLGVSAPPIAPPTVPAGKNCRNGRTVLAAGAVTFADEPEGAGYRRQVRITECRTTPCGGITHADLRHVEVTVSYRPLTARGVGTTDTAVRLDSLIARR
jgi:prepilin-type N-terminal cleavage/methylation domain-containing protein